MRTEVEILRDIASVCQAILNEDLVSFPNAEEAERLFSELELGKGELATNASSTV